MANKPRNNNPIKTFFRLITLAVLSGFLVYFSTLLYITYNAERNTLQNKTADVAIVLGATPYWDNKINPCLEARVKKGVELYKEGKVTALIVSGGKEPDGTLTESEVMRQIAVENGMNPTYIFEESKATSTYENILYSRSALNYYQAESVVIVTEPYHSPRGELVGKRLLDQVIYTAPATESPCWQTGRYTHLYFLREPVALIYYFLTGKI